MGLTPIFFRLALLKSLSVAIPCFVLFPGPPFAQTTSGDGRGVWKAAVWDQQSGGSLLAENVPLLITALHHLQLYHGQVSASVLGLARLVYPTSLSFRMWGQTAPASLEAYS